MSTEVILAGLGLLGTAIGAGRYFIGSIRSMQNDFLKSQETQQSKLYEYIETKNGHLERIANRFADSHEKVATELDNLGKILNTISLRRNVRDRRRIGMTR